MKKITLIAMIFGIISVSCNKKQENPSYQDIVVVYNEDNTVLVELDKDFLDDTIYLAIDILHYKDSTIYIHGYLCTVGEFLVSRGEGCEELPLKVK